MSDIWERRHRIDKERREEQKELMEEYDRTVYYPAKKQLIQECAQIGHVRGKFHDNDIHRVGNTTSRKATHSFLHYHEPRPQTDD